METELEIRLLLDQDLLSLSALARETFFKTFVGTCSEQDMDDFLEQNYSVDAFRLEAQKPGIEIWLVFLAETLCAYLQLNTASTIPELQGTIGLELQRLYVGYAYHGQQIAPQLMDFTFKRARACGKKTVWLGVWEHNERAKRFYEKCGFHYIGSHPFPIGNTPQTDLWMRRDLE